MNERKNIPIPTNFFVPPDPLRPTSRFEDLSLAGFFTINILLVWPTMQLVLGKRTWIELRKSYCNRRPWTKEWVRQCALNGHSYTSHPKRFWNVSDLKQSLHFVLLVVSETTDCSLPQLAFVSIYCEDLWAVATAVSTWHLAWGQQKQETPLWVSGLTLELDSTKEIWKMDGRTLTQFGGHEAVL